MKGFPYVALRTDLAFRLTDFAKFMGCRLVDGKNGTFIGMPRWKGMDGKFHNCASLLLEEDILDDIVEFVDTNL